MTIYRKNIAAKFLNQVLKNQSPALNNATHQYALFKVGAEANLLNGVYTDELSGNGYARVTATNIFFLADSNTQSTTNAISLIFPEPTGVWSKAKYLGIFNADGSELLYFTEIKNSPTGKVGSPVKLNPGSVVWYLNEKVLPSTGNATVQIFNNSTTWTAPSGITSAYMLMVAGGGGGGLQPTGVAGGGGGAGGVLNNVDILANITPGQSYTIIVGSGGEFRKNGGNSSAFGFTAVGGGAGTLDHDNTSANVGGSGGGGSGGGSGTFGAQGIDGQGHAGGNGASVSNTWYSAGGGGGAGGAGNNGTVNGGGAGGAGIWSDISGTNTLYAVGGGGGNYVNATNIATPGTTSTAKGSGGGGGAGAFDSTDQNAGVGGVVIIRYTTV